MCCPFGVRLAVLAAGGGSLPGGKTIARSQLYCIHFVVHLLLCSSHAASAGFTRRAARREFVRAALRDQAVLGADRGQLGEFTRNFLPHPAQGDAEDALSAC